LFQVPDVPAELRPNWLKIATVRQTDKQTDKPEGDWFAR